jgi:hypothetical protein
LYKAPTHPLTPKSKKKNITRKTSEQGATGLLGATNITIFQGFNNLADNTDSQISRTQNLQSSFIHSLSMKSVSPLLKPLKTSLPTNWKLQQNTCSKTSKVILLILCSSGNSYRFVPEKGADSKAQ